MTANYDVFISYASEDLKFASELAGGLKSRGFHVWYADSELKVGEKLLDSVNRGLNESNYGVMLISPRYLEKEWTNYEMDVLLRQHIEKKKRIFPVWHGVTKKEVEARHPGLAGIMALRSEIGMHIIVEKLAREIYKGAPTIAVVPEYESPVWRFTQGIGELKIANEGPAFTLWEAVVHMREDQYPIGVEGEVFTKKDLLLYAAQSLGPNLDIVKRVVGDDGIQRIRKECIDAGIDPDLFY